MEQIKKFLHGKGFAPVLAACLLAAAAAGVWAVRTVRDELRQNLTDLTNPSSTARQTIPEPEPDPDVGLEEEELWLDLPDTAEQAANSVAGVPQPVPGSSSASSGAASGSGSVHEPSALRTDSAPAASSAAPASTQPFSGGECPLRRQGDRDRHRRPVEQRGHAGRCFRPPVAGVRGEQPRRETRRHRDRWAEAGHRGHHQL